MTNPLTYENLYQQVFENTYAINHGTGVAFIVRTTVQESRIDYIVKSAFLEGGQRNFGGKITEALSAYNSLNKAVQMTRREASAPSNCGGLMETDYSPERKSSGA